MWFIIRLEFAPRPGVLAVGLVATRLQQDASQSFRRGEFVYVWPRLTRLYLTWHGLVLSDLVQPYLALMNLVMPDLAMLYSVLADLVLSDPVLPDLA